MKKLNVCNEKIIEKLGYKVKYFKNFANKYFGVISDKKTGKVLPKKELLEDPIECVYEGTNGENIYILDDNDIMIEVNDNLTIITSNVLSYGFSIITKRPSLKSIEIDFLDLNEHPTIRISIGSREVGEIYYDDNDCYFVYRGISHSIPIEECTTEKYIEVITKMIKKFDHGSCWKKDYITGLEIINPALVLCAREFQRAWIRDIERKIGLNNQTIDINKSLINDANRNIRMSNLDNGILEGVKEVILNDVKGKRRI